MKNIKHILTLSMILICSQVVVAQTTVLEWANQIGGAEMDRGHAVTVDDNGNVFSTGLFTSTVDFDPGPATSNLTSLWLTDIYIHKTDIDGNFLWARQLGGGSAWNMYVADIATDANGNVYVIGHFQGTMEYDPGTGVVSYPSAGEEDIFIHKLDANGGFVWTKILGGAGEDRGLSIAVDNSGDLLTTGYFEGTVDFDPGPGVSNLNAVYSDVFVQKLDANGDLVWVKHISGNYDAEAYSITTDANNNVYTTGQYDGTIDFDPGPGIYNLTAIEYNVFIQKLDANGDFLWAKQNVATVNVISRGITTDINGDVLIIGDFNGDVDFDPGTGTENLTCIGGRDIFIQKLDSNGDLLWVKQMGDTDSDEGQSITTDSNGNIFSTGTFRYTVDFDPNLGVFDLVGNGGYDIFIQKLDANGDFVWATQIGGPEFDYGYSIATDYNDDVYTTGLVGSAVDYDPGVGTTNLGFFGSQDFFVQKLSECTMPNNGVTQAGSLLTADETGVDYQWLDCDDNYALISGATNQSFIPSSITGNYAVELTMGGCVDTSSCFLVDYTGLSELNSDFFTIYPNPTSGEYVNIVFNQQGDYQLTISDIAGSLVVEVVVNENEYQLDISTLSEGIYIVSIESDGTFFSKRIVIQ